MHCICVCVLVLFSYMNSFMILTFIYYVREDNIPNGNCLYQATAQKSSILLQQNNALLVILMYIFVLLSYNSNFL